jgi:hypothetical protein
MEEEKFIHGVLKEIARLKDVELPPCFSPSYELVSAIQAEYAAGENVADVALRLVDEFE